MRPEELEIMAPAGSFESLAAAVPWKEVPIRSISASAT